MSASEPTTGWDATLSTDPPVYPTFDSDTEVSFEFNTGTYRQAAALRVGGITNPLRGPLPEEGEPFTLVLRRDDYETSFTLDIDSVGRNQKGKVDLRGYSLVRRLHQTPISGSYKSKDPGALIREVATHARVPGVLPSAFPPEDLRQDSGDGSTEPITADYQSVPASGVIEDVCRQQGWSWRFFNSALWYGDQESLIPLRLAEEFVDFDREAELGLQAGPRTHQLRWILPDDDKPQTQAYPFDLIQVIGKPVTQGTNRTVHVADPIVAELPIGTDGDSQGLPRAHRFASEKITTQNGANRLAKMLWKTVQRQSTKGGVRTVGDPRIRPLDRVVMPESLGGANYLVNSVSHTIAEGEGFITTIAVGSQPDLSTMPPVSDTLTPASIVSGNDGDGDGQPDGGTP